MKCLIIALGLVSSVAVAKNGYMDDHKTINHDCSKEPEIAIFGNDNTVTITGTCLQIGVMGNKNTVTIASTTRVSIAGNENKVDIDATDALSTSGNNNTVTWKKAISGAKPAVRNPGRGNKVTQTK